MEEILGLLNERIEKAVGEVHRLRGEVGGLNSEKEGLYQRINELEQRIRELEGERDSANHSSNERMGMISGRIEEILRKLDGIA